MSAASFASVADFIRESVAFLTAVDAPSNLFCFSDPLQLPITLNLFEHLPLLVVFSVNFMTLIRS